MKSHGFMSEVYETIKIVCSDEYDEFNGWNIEETTFKEAKITTLPGSIIQKLFLNNMHTEELKLRDDFKINNIISIPYSIVDEISEITISRKNIYLNDNIVVFGKYCELVYNVLKTFGINCIMLTDSDNCSIYPKIVYNSFNKLVPVQWVNRQIKENKNCLIFEVDQNIKDDTYLKGHIPTAVYFNTNLFETHPLWNVSSDVNYLFKLMKSYGMKKDKIIVLYSSGSTRLYSILCYLGFKNVRLINGGFEKWKMSNFEIEYCDNIPQKIEPELELEAEVVHNTENIFISSNELVNLIIDQKEKYFLLDTRSFREFSGKNTGYPYMKKRGRIKTSRFFSDQYYGLDKMHYRSILEFKAMFEKIGITDNDHKIILYCGTGWRAATIYFFGSILGYKNIKIYDGGWNEWTSVVKNWSLIESGMISNKLVDLVNEVTFKEDFHPERNKLSRKEYKKCLKKSCINIPKNIQNEKRKCSCGLLCIKI